MHRQLAVRVTAFTALILPLNTALSAPAGNSGFLVTVSDRWNGPVESEVKLYSDRWRLLGSTKKGQYRSVRKCVDGEMLQAHPQDSVFYTSSAVRCEELTHIVLRRRPDPAQAKVQQLPGGARLMQVAGNGNIPQCAHSLGSVTIVEPDNQWWRELNLGSPEAILKIFIQQSGCFKLVDRGRAMQSRSSEHVITESGDLLAGSNLGKGQVKAADYFLQPDLLTSNSNDLGNVMGGLLGGHIGAIAGALNTRKKEANVTLSVVNVRTTEEEALTKGYAHKSDLGFGAGGAGWLGGFAAVGGSGYQNTEMGQVIVKAYLDSYVKLVTQLGGIPDNASVSGSGTVLLKTIASTALMHDPGPAGIEMTTIPLHSRLTPTGVVDGEWWEASFGKLVGWVRQTDFVLIPATKPSAAP